MAHDGLYSSILPRALSVWLHLCRSLCITRSARSEPSRNTEVQGRMRELSALTGDTGRAIMRHGWRMRAYRGERGVCRRIAPNRVNDRAMQRAGWMYLRRARTCITR